jgi:hypothetical protein
MCHISAEHTHYGHGNWELWWNGEEKKQCTCFSLASVNYLFICCLGLRSYMHITAIQNVIFNGLKLSSIIIFKLLHMCHYWYLLSTVILKLLLIIGITNGSYSKITYSYNSHISSYTVRNHIQMHTQVHKHNKHRYNYI